VQKRPGDAAVALIQQAARKSGDRGSTLLLRAHQTRFSQTSQIRETKNRAYEFAARRSLHAGKVPNVFPDEVRLEKPVAPPKSSAACRKFLNSFPAHMLELAKGFEPPTLGLQNRCSTD
jgi:hypothetical protein